MGFIVGEKQMFEGADERGLVDFQSVEMQRPLLLAAGSTGAEGAKGLVRRKATKLDFFESARWHRRNLRPVREVSRVDPPTLAVSTIGWAMLELKGEKSSGQRIKAFFVKELARFGHPGQDLPVEVLARDLDVEGSLHLGVPSSRRSSSMRTLAPRSSCWGPMQRGGVKEMTRPPGPEGRTITPPSRARRVTR